MGRSRQAELSCEQVPALVQAFVAGGLSPRENRRLHVHLDDCDDCTTHYREAVRTAAAIGHERRTERVESEKVLRRWRLRRNVFAAGVSGGGRSSRLRTLLYPAFFCYLIFQLASLGQRETGLALETLAGEVQSGPRLQKGELASTGPAGRARLEADGASAILEPSTRLFLEGTSPLRLRLVEGALELDGTWLIATTMGVVELEDARARVELGPGGLACESDTGSVRVIDADGEHPLAAGETMRLATNR